VSSHLRQQIYAVAAQRACVRPLFEIQNIKRTVLYATVGDSPAVRDRQRVMGANSLSAVGYLFEVRAPVIVYHSGDVTSIANESYGIMFLFLTTLSLCRRDRLLLYKFWSSTSCKTRSLSVEDQLRPRPLLFIIIIKYSLY